MRQMFIVTGLIVAIGAVIAGCGSLKSRDDVQNEKTYSDLKPSLMEEQPGEVSLKADRSELSEARQNIPEEIKKQNDEIALIMSFIVRDSEEEPNRVRDRFSSAIRKKREAIDKKMRHAREEFTKRERADRELFLKKSKEARNEFTSGRKRSSDERKRFFEEQEDSRKSFFADQADRRKDFESHVSEERKAVEDFNREKQNAFNQEWRTYQVRFNERKKQMELKKRMEVKSRELERNDKPVSSVTRPTDPLLEFDQIPSGPGVQLDPGKKGN